MHDPDWYLVAYDIADPRRLRRLHRRLRREGVALQESVFLLNRTQRDIALLMKELEGFIEAREDDLRAYPVPHPSEIWLRGQGLMDGACLHPGAAPKTAPPPPPRRGWWQRLLGDGPDHDSRRRVDKR